MDKLVECVPNFSEGRDRAKVEAIVREARSAGRVVVLDLEMDPDHNRSVLSFVAPPEDAVEAAFRASRKAAELIDLTRHKGEHPRMGATDVIPFIPVRGLEMEECVRLAGLLAERIARELHIPTYLYDRAARRPERKDLANVRKGQFEGLLKDIEVNPERAPDYGPRRLHPTAGATAVGAREQIINFNVNLRTRDMALGQQIARKIRASSGGMPAVRAKEIDLKDKGMVQVSTVLTDYRTTSLAAVHDAIGREAQYAGVEIDSAEIVGLVPRPALLGFILDALKLKGFDPKAQILEDRLLELQAPPGEGWEAAADKVIDAVQAATPTPGGGAVSAFTGAMAAGLGRMVAGISARHFEKKADPALAARLADLKAADGELAGLIEDLRGLMREDARAFDAVMAGYKRAKDDPGRPAAIQQALVQACEVPFRTAQAASAAIKLLKKLEASALETVASDLKTGRVLARSAVHGALENVSINLGSIKDADYVRTSQQRMKDVLHSMG